MTIDRLFEQPEAPREFVFDERVAHVFDDMIGRSVPGYRTIISSLAPLIIKVVPPNGRVYDLGCSLGAGLLSMHNARPDCELIGMDNSVAMLEQARERLPVNITLQHADVIQAELQPCDVVVLNFTLQFLPIAQRLPLLQNIAAALQPHGWLVLSEKIQIPDQQSDDLLIDLHHQFKKAQGYSDMEIARKRQALENTLLPETGEVHEARLREAGFAHITRWHQQFNFVSWLARV